MSKEKKAYHIIISGGGTGGHIFPALAIADGLKASGLPVEILFVGAEGRMEMEKVPAAGYPIEGLEISGIQRSLTTKNFAVPFKIVKSLLKAKSIINNFKPDIAIGVGGYASGPMLFAASLSGVPTVIQEQNSYPGVTNKILAKRAKMIFVAYEGMQKFFPADKLVLAGNPVRALIAGNLPTKEEACNFFGLDVSKPVIFSFGGSLGARTINQSIEKHLDVIKDSGAQLIWQTGKAYFNQINQKLDENDWSGLKVMEFLKEMHFAFAAADVIISRAGALSIAELCLVGKPVILVPSPNVSEDHQTKNAMALVNNGAAILVTDKDAQELLIPTALDLLKNESQRNSLSIKIKQMAIADATDTIVKNISQILQNNDKL
jgi:UDP-N-acetylglucosamine--N-acetylmuramyl-(pentapeptide) pyrophosphoryl-undecaprenol N-acetylglucosamine transferase